VPTTPFSGDETTRVVGWQGALLQKPYRAVLEQVRDIPTGVYVSCTLYGSPASTVLRPGVWIVEVQGRPVKDLDSFLEAIHSNEIDLRRVRRPSYVPPVKRKKSLPLITELDASKEDHEDGITDGNEAALVDEGKIMEMAPDGQDAEDDDDNDEGYVRIKTVSRAGVTKVVAMKLDTHYWDTWELARDENAVCGWVCLPA
jgi:hypothetical protein